MGSGDLRTCSLLACLLGGLSLAAIGCESSSPSCGSYPAVPEGATSIVHVSGECASGTANGSVASPYATIQAAIEVAPTDSTILVDPDVYDENLWRPAAQKAHYYWANGASHTVL